MKIVVGVCGGIAAYRAIDFTKQLLELGHEVEVVFTRAADEFVTPLSFESFTGKKVWASSAFSKEKLGTEHIKLARWADSFIIYAATANVMAKIAAGMADDFLSTQLLAFEGKVLMVPAMNTSMWQNRYTQSNLDKLKDDPRIEFVGPVDGVLACREKGVGHIAEDKEILDRLEVSQDSKIQTLKGKRVLISGGPMRSYLDSVRYIENSSSGLSACLLAAQAKMAGAEVELLLGKGASARPQEDQTTHYFESPADYLELLDLKFPQCDIFVSLAAVLDFEVQKRPGKLSRQQLGSRLELELIEVPDMVGRMVASKSRHQKVVAFALQSGDIEAQMEAAKSKLEAKGADFIVLNPAQDGRGPHAELNDWTLIFPPNSNKKPLKWQALSKDELSRRLCQLLAQS